MINLEYFRNFAHIVFKDIVSETTIIHFKLRITLKDKSYIDIYLPPKRKGGFAFHWERRHIDNTFYRYDNYPDVKWRKIKLFPYHFHNGSQNKVVNPIFSKDIKKGFKDFMEFVKDKLRK